jgi:polysaccharide biosynthesis transport protein
MNGATASEDQTRDGVGRWSDLLAGAGRRWRLMPRPILAALALASNGPAPAGDEASMPKRLKEPWQPEPSGPADFTMPSEEADAAARDFDRAARALTERLTRSLMPGERLAALIAGNASGRALTTALETARRLSAAGPTLLVDLGQTQDWFTDILQREEADSPDILGLADLIVGKASFGDIIRRDLSSGLDVIPAGGDTAGEPLEEVFAALTSAYSRVVFHASDWRSKPARLAAQFADAVVLVAPAVVLRRIAEEARDELQGSARLLPFAVPRPHPAFEDAA